MRRERRRVVPYASLITRMAPSAEYALLDQHDLYESAAALCADA